MYIFFLEHTHICVSVMSRRDLTSVKQIMRSKNNTLKTVPFQPLKDSSGAAYAVTLARFYVFGLMFFDQICDLKTLVERSLEEEYRTDVTCCLESFILCLAQNAPSHKNADALQHAAMQMRRSLRGVALLKTKQMNGNELETYCDSYLNPKRATPFAALTGQYYQIKRCIPHEKRLLIHRTDPDAEFPAGSAVLVSVSRARCINFVANLVLKVDTGRELKRVTWNMVRTVVTTTLDDIQSELDKISLPGQVHIPSQGCMSDFVVYIYHSCNFRTLIWHKFRTSKMQPLELEYCHTMHTCSTTVLRYSALRSTPSNILAASRRM